MTRNRFAAELRSKSDPKNLLSGEEILRCGEFQYRVCLDFPKWPELYSGYQVCGTFCDGERFYATTRCPECPVAVFDMEGNFLRVLGEDLLIGRAHGIAKDHGNRIFLADDGNHVVYCLDDRGTLIHTVGTFQKPSDTGFDETIEGHLAYLTVKRRGDPFNKPTRMVQGPDGRYYASDGYGNAAVHCFDRSLEHLFSWGRPGTGEGEFSIVHSLTVDCRNRVLVADRDNDRLQVFDGDGTFIRQVGHLLYPCDVVSDLDFIYVAENDGRVSIFTLDFQLVAQLGYSASMFRGHSIALDGKGNIYLGLLHGNYNVIKLERI